MKNALILHATGANPHSNWYDWLSDKFILNGYEVYVPNLPHPNNPDLTFNRRFIFAGSFEFSPETVIVGHSSGAVLALKLLEMLPRGASIDTAVMVGAYAPTAPLDVLRPDMINGKARRLVFVHGDSDTVASSESAREIAREVGGKFVLVSGGQHFVDEKGAESKELPELARVLGLR